MQRNNPPTTLLNPKKTNYKLIILLSLLISAFSVIPVLIFNKGNLFLAGDYLTQQIPFIKECRRVILSGTPFWSCNTFLGANFIGTYSFYVYTSPFFWPLLIVPESCIGIALAAVFILKHVVAALTSHLYLSRYSKNINLTIVGSLMYAFSSFTMDSSYYYHFLEVIAFFPLLLFFTDRVLENKSKALFALTVLFTATLNFYFFVSTSFIFLFYIFFKVRFSEKYTWKDAFRSIILYGVGAIGSAVIMLPSGLYMLETSKVAMTYSNKFLSALLAIPQSIKIIEGIILPAEGIMGSGVGFTFAMFNSNAAFLPLFGAFFLFIALRKKEKAWDYKLMKLFVFLSFIPFGNGLFSFFSNMSYTRWWYGFVLISIVVSLHVIEDMNDNPSEAKLQYKKSAKLITVLGSVVTLGPLLVKLLSAYLLKDFLLSKFPKGFLSYLESSHLLEKFTLSDLRYTLVLALLITLSYLPLYIFIKKGWLKSKKIVPVVTVICMISYCAYLTNEYLGFKEAHSQIYIDEAEQCVSEGTDYSHRVRNKKSIVNYSMISNEPGVDTFHTVKSTSTSDFCRIVGYECGTMPTTKRYFSTPAIQAVLSITETVNSDSSREAAQYYVPMGFVYDYYIEDTGYEFTTNTKENDRRIQLMTQACFIDAETANQLSSVVKPLGDNEINWQEACKQKAATACEEFTMNTEGFTTVSEGEKERLVFFSIPHDNGWKAYVNGKETQIYDVNGGLMGIVVPEGRSEIEFNFMPPGLISGAAITAISLVVIAGIGIFEVIRRKKEN